MKTLLDVHTHTIASGHAYSSLQEMTMAAKEKGLKYWESQSTDHISRAPVIPSILETCIAFPVSSMESS